MKSLGKKDIDKMKQRLITKKILEKNKDKKHNKLIKRSDNKLVTWDVICNRFDNIEHYLKSLITFEFMECGIIDENNMNFIEQKCSCGNMVDGNIGVCDHCCNKVVRKQIMAYRKIKDKFREQMNNMWNSNTKVGTLVVPGTDVGLKVSEAAAIQAKFWGSKKYKIKEPLFYSNHFVKIVNVNLKYY
jgi:hypothetical protein